jgi:hypothetical protein
LLHLKATGPQHHVKVRALAEGRDIAGMINGRLLSSHIGAQARRAMSLSLQNGPKTNPFRRQPISGASALPFAPAEHATGRAIVLGAHDACKRTWKVHAAYPVPIKCTGHSSLRDLTVTWTGYCT